MSSYNSTGGFHSPVTSPMGSYASTTGSYLEGFQDAEDEVLASHGGQEGDIVGGSPERASGAAAGGADPFKLVTPSKLSSAHKREVERARGDEGGLNGAGDGGAAGGAGALRASLERGPVALSYGTMDATVTGNPAESPGRVHLRHGNGEVYGVISTRRNLGDGGGGGKPKVKESSDSFSRFARWRTDSFSRFQRYKETTSLLPSTRSDDDDLSKHGTNPCCFGSLSRVGCGLIFLAAVALFAFGVVFAVPPMARNQIKTTSISL